MFYLSLYLHTIPFHLHTSYSIVSYPFMYYGRTRLVDTMEAKDERCSYFSRWVPCYYLHPNKPSVKGGKGTIDLVAEIDLDTGTEKGDLHDPSALPSIYIPSGLPSSARKYDGEIWQNNMITQQRLNRVYVQRVDG